MVPLPSRLGTLSSITHSFPWLSSPRGYVTYVVLPRSPLSPLRVLARLACLIHAANVHSEPGSNPFEICFYAAASRPHVTLKQVATEPRRHRMRTFRACLPTHAKDVPRNNGTLSSTATPRTTEPIWLTHAEHPLPYNKADFSEPSNQIVKEQLATALAARSLVHRSV